MIMKCDVIYQTREGIGNIYKHKWKGWKYVAKHSIFGKLKGVFKSVQIWSWVFDISS